MKAQKGFAVLSILFYIVMGIISVTLVKATINEVSNLSKIDKNIPIPTITVTPTIYPTDSPFPTYKFNPTPTIDADPIVSCYKNIYCNGTSRVKRSECNKVCCLVGDDKWELVANKDECNKKRDEYYDKLNQEIQLKYAVTPYASPILSQDQIDFYEAKRKADYEACRQDVISYYKKIESQYAASNTVDSYGVGGFDQYAKQREADLRRCSETYSLCSGVENCLNEFGN